MDGPGEKTKIAIISSSFPPYISGGISSAHYNLYLVLKKKGYIVKCFTYTDHYSNETSNLDVIRFGTPGLLLKLLRIFSRFYRIVLSRFEVFEFAYQFPYCLESAVGSWKIGRALRKFNPDVLVLPDNGAPGYFIPKQPNCKTIFISHHNFLRFIDEPLLGKFSRKDAEMAHYMERVSLGKVDLVLCPSHYMKDVFLKTNPFKGPVLVIPNIVDQDLIESILPYDIRAKLKLPEQAPLIYIPSAGSTVKGSKYVFEIIRRLSFLYGKDLGFYLSGGMNDELLEREMNYLPENAKLYVPGHLGYEENVATIKACNLCVSPTLVESFGMALLEANFCSVPVVAFNVGGNIDIITNGENGYLVDFMDIENLILSAISILSDKEILESMKDKSSCLAISRFGSELLGNQYEQLMI